MKCRKNRIKNITKAAIAIIAVASLNGGFTTISVAQPAPPPSAWRYADMADLFAGAPMVLRAKITAATALKAPPAPDRSVRFYVEGNVVSLIRGTQAVPPKLVWLVDLRPDSRGKMPKLKKADVLIAALPVAGRPGEIRLAARDAQIFWTAELETQVRAIVTAATAPDAPPLITGVASAFHTAGTITGEGETQIFLSTPTGSPVSLSVLTRPNQPKFAAVSFGEIVDEAATLPHVETLPWYRLACFLPPALPQNVIGDATPTDSMAIRDDYAFILKTLGGCPRVRR